MGTKGPSGRLDSSDANFVDAIHTSVEFGMGKDVGDADYYPNGGDNQPLCATAAMPGKQDGAIQRLFKKMNS